MTKRKKPQEEREKGYLAFLSFFLQGKKKKKKS
jgi:hypothetical protein